MALEGVLNVSEAFEDAKENTVQTILDDSVNVEIRQRSDSTESRLSPLTGNVCELTINLILTSAAHVTPQTLENFNITCMISCAPELPDSPFRDNLVYHRIDIADSGCSRILPYFDAAADLIQRISIMGGRTLVFCVAGVSRSATICIAYLMKYHKLSLKGAYTFVKSRRPRVRPNCGFFKQLIEYEKNLFGYNTVEMVFNDVVQMEIPNVYESDYKVIPSASKKNRSNGRR